MHPLSMSTTPTIPIGVSFCPNANAAIMHVAIMPSEHHVAYAIPRSIFSRALARRNALTAYSHMQSIDGPGLVKPSEYSSIDEAMTSIMIAPKSIT